MREIEIKAKIANPQDVLQKLEALDVKLGPVLVQHDVVYGQPNVTTPVKGAVWLRIRTENDSKVYFTLKRRVTHELDKIEHEVAVSDAAELQAIIKNLGFELFSDITKRRRKGTLGPVEICFDEVDNLGTFLEAELLAQDDADVAAVNSQLWTIFAKLGVAKTDEITSGYDVLMRRQQEPGQASDDQASTIIYHTDGSCSPNPGPGGFAVIKNMQPAVLGREPDSTNIRMEGQAIIAALKDANGQPCAIHTDSEFWINVITKWSLAWEKAGWKKKNGEIKNLDIVKEVCPLFRKSQATLVWVRGHNDDEGNELADQWANKARQGATL